MMQKKLTFIFLSILPMVFSIESSSQDLNYKNYYSAINKAEINIANEKYQNAIAIYDTLFKIYTPFDNDIYNATLCAIATNDCSKVITYCKLLQLSGDYSINTFNHIAAFKKISKRKDWKDFEKQESGIKLTAKLPVDFVFLVFRHELYQKEQDAYDDRYKFYFQSYENTKILDSLFANQPERLKAMFQGASYEYIAMMNHYYTLYANKNSSIRDTLENYYSKEEKSFYNNMDLDKYNLDSLYKIAVMKGYLHAKTYEMACMNKNGFLQAPNIHGFIFRDSIDLIWIIPSEQVTMELNQFRKDLGMGSFEDDVYKFVKTNALYKNFSTKDYDRMLKKLETKYDWEKLDNLNKVQVFLPLYNDSFTKAKLKAEMSKSNFKYSFKFATVPISFTPENPGGRNSKSKESLLEMYYIYTIGSRRLNDIN